MAFEIRYYNANSVQRRYQDDIKFVTEFSCFLGHPVKDINISKHL